MEIHVNSDGDPFLDQFSEGGFVDLTFRISGLVRDSHCYRFHAAASHGGRSVGMDVIVEMGMQGGFDEDMNLVKENVYRRGVCFLRSGPESDRLISAIGELYGSTESQPKMVEAEAFTAIALHKGPIDMERQAVKLKLFGRDDEPFDEEAYYESFFHIDIPNGFMLWNEKDGDYRKPLLEAMSCI